MHFQTFPSPHLPPINSVPRIMIQVLAALIPGMTVLVWQFGTGVLAQTTIALLTGWSAEALCLILRQRTLKPLLDGSATLTAVLLAVSLPPHLDWWMTALGTLFSIVIGKQIYGGLGYNPFNPAMVGYAALLISFPRQMTLWPPSIDLLPIQLGFSDLTSLIFQDKSSVNFDAIAQATPLDTLKTQLAMHTDLDEIQSSAIFGGLSGKGWQWVNFGFLSGGLWLLRRRIIDWRIPTGFLGSLFLMAMYFFLYDPANYPTPLFHWFSGATMLGAFFIATDPVTASTTPRGRLVYGALAGVLVYVIRSWGGYPDSVAFAILLMNFAAPTIDHYTRPRIYGHDR